MKKTWLEKKKKVFTRYFHPVWKTDSTVNHNFWCFLCVCVGGTSNALVADPTRQTCVLGFKNKAYLFKALNTHHSKPRSHSIRTREVLEKYQIRILYTKDGSSRFLPKISNHLHTVRSRKTIILKLIVVETLNIMNQPHYPIWSTSLVASETNLHSVAIPLCRGPGSPLYNLDVSKLTDFSGYRRHWKF